MAADDGYEPSADEVVTVGYVNVAVSPLVVTELQSAGIRAEAVEQRGAYGGPVVKARILCFAPQRDEAAAIIDRVLGGTDSAR